VPLDGLFQGWSRLNCYSRTNFAAQVQFRFAFLLKDLVIEFYFELRFLPLPMQESEAFLFSVKDRYFWLGILERGGHLLLGVLLSEGRLQLNPLHALRLTYFEEVRLVAAWA